eukprot:14490173-Alexandrium_andersonii.AAC.1
MVEASGVDDDHVGPRLGGNWLFVVPSQHAVGGQVGLRKKVVVPHHRLFGFLVLWSGGGGKASPSRGSSGSTGWAQGASGLHDTGLAARRRHRRG